MSSANLIPKETSWPKLGQLPQFAPVMASAAPISNLMESYANAWPLLLFGGWPAVFFSGLTTLTRSFKDTLKLTGSDVRENDREIVISTEIPGFQDNEVEAKIRDGRLTIKAERHQTTKNQDEVHMSYRQSVSLPAGFNLEDAETSYRNSVLEIHIPKPGTGEKKPQVENQEEKQLEPQEKAEQAGPSQHEKSAGKPKPGRNRERQATAGRGQSKADARSNPKRGASKRSTASKRSAK